MSVVLSPSAVSLERRAVVVVRAPARLHLGFLDPSGSLGRHYGSLGLVIDGLETVVQLGASDRDEFSAGSGADPAELDRAAGYLQRLRERSGRQVPLALRLLQTMPAHAGFGYLVVLIGPPLALLLLCAIGLVSVAVGGRRRRARQAVIAAALRADS